MIRYRPSAPMAQQVRRSTQGRPTMPVAGGYGKPNVAPTQPPLKPDVQPFDARANDQVDRGTLAYGDDTKLIDRREQQFNSQTNPYLQNPSDPFSQAELLKRNYEQSLRGSQNSLAAQGQTYSGAVGRQAEDINWRYAYGQAQQGKGSQAWEKSREGAAWEFGYDRDMAKRRWLDTAATAGWDSLDRGLAQEPEDHNLVAAPVAGKVPTPKPKKPKYGGRRPSRGRRRGGRRGYIEG